MRLGRPGLRAVFLFLVLTLPFALAAESGAAWEYGDWAVASEDTNHINQVVAVTDGQEGMIVAGIHQVPFGYHRIWVNRFDHTGTEIWGNDGIYLPLDPGAQWDYGPLDVVADLSGGAYIGFRRGFGSYEMYMVAHVESWGALDWMVPVDQVGGYSLDHPGLQVELGTFGGVFVFYIQFDASEFQKIKVVHFDTEGGIHDFGDVYSSSTAKRVSMSTAGSWPDGALVAWSRFDGGVSQTGAQRILQNSGRAWGNDGVQVMTDADNDPVILSDGSDGAFIVASKNGQALGQHLDATGTPQWTAGGKLLHDSHCLYPIQTTNPDICSDGAGGLYLVHGQAEGYVQRVTSTGALPWGAGGIQVATELGYSQPVGRLAADGHEGAILAFHTWFEVGGTGPACEQVRAMKIEGGGGIIWDSPLWSCSDAPKSGASEPVTWPSFPQVVADGTGGAKFIWSESSPRVPGPGSHDLRILAGGLNPDGLPAIPRLHNMVPGSGQADELLTVEIFGEYLHTDQTFRIQKDPDPPITITGNWMITNQHIQGDLDLTSAPDGIYDLVVSTGDTDHNALPGAIAVGPPLPCLPDAPFGLNPSNAITGGSRRKAAFGPDGTLHMAWIEFHDSLFRIYHWDDTMGLEEADLIRDFLYPVRELSFGVGNDGIVHYVYAADVGSTNHMEYIRDWPDGRRISQTMPVPGGARCPSLAVAGSDAHVVFESDIESDSWLFHMPATETGFGTIQDIMSGPNARGADLAEGDGGLVLTFVRDHEVPGLREVCYQFFNGASWEPPTPLSAGLSLYSPSIVWDDDQRTLVAWIQDSTGSDPVLHTCLMTMSGPGPIRWRPSDGIIYAVTVDTPGNGVFYLMTRESETGFPVNMNIRQGDGEAFYPKRRLNSSDDVDYPLFTVEYGTHRIAAWWEEYDEVGHPYHHATCHFDISGVPEVLPVAEAMMTAYPNPFNPMTRVMFVLPEGGRTSLVLYDLRGRRVRTLVEGELAVGPHTVPWDGRDEQGRALASGVYFGKLTLPGGKEELIIKLALIR